jgi:hypothetical protein
LWKARELSLFVNAVQTRKQVPATAATVVDDTTVAGRLRSPLSEVIKGDTVQYLRVEPEPPPTASWERRTWPVVSLGGTPPALVRRQVHLETADCGSWEETAVEKVYRMMD